MGEPKHGTARRKARQKAAWDWATRDRQFLVAGAAHEHLSERDKHRLMELHKISRLPLPRARRVELAKRCGN